MTPNYLDIALRHAVNGYAVFPVRPDKTPYPGFMNWEAQATIGLAAIRRWWKQYPDALPAVAPGLSHHTVIDVDRKPGKPDGFESLALHGISLEDTPTYAFASLSGLGFHFWFRGKTTSVNHVIPGVDRKSSGGYVVVPYLLPLAQNVTVAAPALLLGSKIGTRNATEATFTGSTRDWLSSHTTGRTLSQAVANTVRPFIAGAPFTGHDAMLRWQIHLVKLASEGHAGVPEALEFGREVWLDSPHASAEDPAREWDIALDRAITKYGGGR